MDFTPLPEGLRYGGFWRRCAAFAFDLLILFVLTNGMLLAAVGWEAFSVEPGMRALVVSSVVSLVVPVAYTVGFWRWKGATPGKMAFDMRIVDEETLGHPTWAQLVWRCFAYVASTMVFFLGFVLVAFSRRKQSLHDRLAGTLVVVDRRGGPDLEGSR